MTEAIPRLTTEESRVVMRRRKRGNLLLMLVLCGFVGAMFVLCFAHMQTESGQAAPKGGMITDQ
jgi:hypothetical protein